MKWVNYKKEGIIMKKLLAVILCLMALCCFALAEAPEGLEYAEDFEDGVYDVALTDNCEPACFIELAEEEGNKYLHVVTHTGDAENGYVQVAFGPELRNFDFCARVRPFIKNPDWNWMKVVFRAVGDQGGAGYENESYLFNIWEWRGVFAIKSNINRKSENDALVENQDFWFENGTWYNIRVEARDTNIKVYVDDALCVEYTDEEDLRPEGVFGFCAWGANFDIDDLAIVSYDEPKAEAAEEVPAGEAAEEAILAEPVDLLPLITAEAGNISAIENGVRVAGRNADFSGDAYTNSWLILQKKVADFELTFDYTPQLTGWNMDRICFRCAGDENEWNQYQLLLFGDQFGDGASGVRVVKGEALDPAFGYYAVNFVPGTTYEFKVVVAGKNVKVCMNDELIIDVDLPAVEGAEYHDAFIAAGDFQVVSWAGDFVMTHMEVKELPATEVELAPAEEKPEEPAVEKNAPVADENGVYDLLPFIAAESGNITEVENGVRVAGRNADFSGDGYTNSWLILQKKVADFELCFDYTPALTAWNMDRVCFRCAGDENEWNQYQLLLFGSAHGEGASGLRIVKGEALDPAFAYYPVEFAAGTTYELKLTVKGNHVAVALNDEVVMEADLPTAETTEYHDMYVAEGDVQLVSWAGDFTISHMELAELKAE